MRKLLDMQAGASQSQFLQSSSNYSAQNSAEGNTSSRINSQSLSRIESEQTHRPDKQMDYNSAITTKRCSMTRSNNLAKEPTGEHADTVFIPGPITEENSSSLPTETVSQAQKSKRDRHETSNEAQRKLGRQVADVNKVSAVKQFKPVKLHKTSSRRSKSRKMQAEVFSRSRNELGEPTP